MVIFRSTITGLLGLTPPIVLSILFNYGLMGYLEIPLDIVTALISLVAVGVGLDYSIHFLTHFKIELDNKKTYADAMTEKISHSGKAIVSNAS